MVGRNATYPGLALVLALTVVGCADSGSGSGDAAVPAFLNMDAQVEYVGQQACRDCHLEQFGTFVETGMGRSFYPMTPDEVVEDFTADNLLIVQESGLHYRMEERDGRFYQVQFMLDSRGREVARDERELLYVMGSNNHSRSYMTETNERLFQAPVCWYPQEEMWELCPGYEFKNDHFAREISSGCVHCHNGVMTLVEGERNKYEKPYPHGIGCERCHGPGQLHVERWNAGGETPTGELDLTIVNPRRLPGAERIEVCFQCHLGDAKASERVIRYDRPVGSFRPGQRITDSIIPYRYEQQTIHDFGLSAQADRLMQSRCYKQSGGRIECLTCHNPHVTVYRENRPDNFFNQKCLSCHAGEDCTAPRAERDATEPTDDCVSCHMRKAEPDDQRFTEFTDHWIRRDINVTERDHRDRFAVEPIYPERLDDLTEGEQAFYRARAMALLSEDAPQRHRPAIWAETEQNFQQAVDQGFDNVYSRFFHGKIFQFMGRGDEATESFERAHAHDPSHLDAAYALGQAMVQRGQLERAMEIFTGILEQDPDSVMAMAEIGRTLSLMGQSEEALGYLVRAMEIEPWTPSLRVNYGKLLAKLGRYDEAAAAGAEAVRLDPDDAKVWEFYGRANLAAGKPEAAQEAMRFVQRLAE